MSCFTFHEMLIITNLFHIMKRLFSCGAEAMALLGSVTSVIPADALSALAARMTLGMTLTPYPQHYRKWNYAYL